MEALQWTYEKRKISELTANEINPRRLSKTKGEQLKNSLESFGLCQPIVIQPDGFIIGGHQRIQILKRLGRKTADCAIPSRELSKDEISKLSIILNKVQGEFDFDILANNWDVEILMQCGFTSSELHGETVKESKPKVMCISVTFDDEDDLRHVEKELHIIVSQFPSANMKVRCK